jgi:hypothetical protein
MVPIGTPSEEQKRDCTRVLKGVIALSRAQFPRAFCRHCWIRLRARRSGLRAWTTATVLGMASGISSMCMKVPKSLPIRRLQRHKRRCSRA